MPVGTGNQEIPRSRRSETRKLELAPHRSKAAKSRMDPVRWGLRQEDGLRSVTAFCDRR
jgi:hypothetical protein